LRGAGSYLAQVSQAGQRWSREQSDISFASAPHPAHFPTQVSHDLHLLSTAQRTFASWPQAAHFISATPPPAVEQAANVAAIITAIAARARLRIIGPPGL